MTTKVVGVSEIIAAILLILISVVLVGVMYYIVSLKVQGLRIRPVRLNMPTGEVPENVDGVFYIDVKPAVSPSTPPTSICGANIFAIAPNESIVGVPVSSVGTSLSSSSKWGVAVTPTTQIAYPPQELVMEVAVPPGYVPVEVQVELCVGSTSYWEDLTLTGPAS